MIISGGQTGADRAALDFAIQHGFRHGGWCPRGRLAEDGAIPEQYRLQETPSRRYAERTERNVRDSDATVVFSRTSYLRGGTALTAELARQHAKPCLHLVQEEATVRDHAAQLRGFLQNHVVKRLNVAGPRDSQSPGIAAYVDEVLKEALVEGHPDSSSR